MGKRVWIFLILTYLLASIFFISFGFVDIAYKRFVLLLAMFMPMISVFIVKVIYKTPLKGKYFLKLKFNKYVLIAILLPLVINLTLVVFNIISPNASFEINSDYLEQLSNQGISTDNALTIILVSTIVNGLLAGITVNAIAAFGEELGWRGFLQEELSHLGFFKSSAIIGAIWGLWHFPVVLQGYNFDTHPILGVFLMIIACTFLGIIISYFTVKSGTILSAMFFHGVFNATAALSLILVDGYVDIYHGPFGLIAIFIYVIITGIIYLLSKNEKKEVNIL